jgi:hypothetical protein
MAHRYNALGPPGHPLNVGTADPTDRPGGAGPVAPSPNELGPEVHPPEAEMAGPRTAQEEIVEFELNAEQRETRLAP